MSLLRLILNHDKISINDAWSSSNYRSNGNQSMIDIINENKQPEKEIIQN